jgi:hypothetical protein
MASFRWTSLALLAGTATAATACNGNAALCDRRYSNVTHVGAHDSAFVGSFVTDNQYTDASTVLDLGVRFLQAQTHNLDGTIVSCGKIDVLGM